jgi:SNF2-related domain
MVAASSEFQTKILRRSDGPDAYRLYRAALEWDLIDPIVIETRKDLKSEKRWQNQLQPYRHQVSNLITFCRRLPVTLLADDVGLGKTISAGLVASELIARARVSKILIVCPKLLGPQWRDELKTKFDRPDLFGLGYNQVFADCDLGRFGLKRPWKNAVSVTCSCSLPRRSKIGCGTFTRWLIS